MKLLSLLLAVFLLCGCASTRPQEQKTVPPTDIQIGNQVLHSLQQESFQELSKTLAGKTTLTISRKDFDVSVKNLKSRLGQIRKFRYLAPLETPLVRNHVWIVSFEKKGPRNTVILRDLLFRLVCVSMDGEVRVAALGFF